VRLEDLKEKVSIVDYIERSGLKLEKAGQNAYRLNPCPVCGHSDHFTIYPGTNSYTSFSGCCRGGSIIDYMIEVEGLEQDQAIERLKELAGETGSDHEQRGRTHKALLKKTSRLEQIRPTDKNLKNSLRTAGLRRCP